MKEPGIYEILCVPTDKRYVGSSKCVADRKKGHFKELRAGTHANIYLQRAYNKYGEDNFVFSLLLVCSVKNLIFFEQQFLDSLSPDDFNICKIAESRLGTKFSDESKKKLSIARKGKYTGFENHNYGKSMFDSTRKKISESLKGRFIGKDSPTYNRKVSEETRRKIGESGIGRIPWNKGLTAKSDWRIKKQADSQKGKHLSQECRNKIKESLIGTHLSEETKRKLSISQKHRWSSEETRKKQSECLKGRISGMKGKQHSEETKLKMKISHRFRLKQKKGIL